jgi:endonuclease III
MKNSKEYAQRLQRLYRGLKRAQPPIEKVTYEDPIEAAIYGIISEHRSDSAAQRAIKRLRETFVDWNDLRVSRIEEVAEILQNDAATDRAVAAALVSVLRTVFDEHHVMSLMALKKQGKRPAKQILDDLQGVSPFVVDYCMLTALEGHAVPLTAGMTRYLKDNGIVDTEASEQEVEGFLTRHIAAKDAYEFYGLLRRESESPKGVKKKTRSKAAANKPKAKRTKRTKK